MGALDREQAVAILNRIVACEMAGVVRYTHYSMTVDGEDREAVASWLRIQAEEGLKHARRAGRLIAMLGGHPQPQSSAPPPDSDTRDVDAMLRDSLRHENEACAAYRELLELSQGRSVCIEDYARDLIVTETTHASQVSRMLRRPLEAVLHAA